MRRGMAQQLLEPHDRHPRLRAVDTEGVPEVVHGDVGPEYSGQVPAAVVKLRRERRGLEEPARAAVVVERGGEDRIGRPAREPRAVCREELRQRLGDRDVAVTRDVLEAPHPVGDCDPPLGQPHVGPLKARGLSPVQPGVEQQGVCSKRTRCRSSSTTGSGALGGS